MKLTQVQYEADDNTIKTVNITAGGQLKTYCEYYTQFSNEARINQNAYIVSNKDTALSLTATVTGGDMLVLQNDDADYNIIIDKIEISSDTAGGVLTLKKNVTLGTITNKNTITPVNSNIASSNTPTVTAYIWNEVGNGIGGITGGTSIMSSIIPADIVPVDLQGAIILIKPKNICVAFTGKAAEITLNIHFYLVAV